LDKFFKSSIDSIGWLLPVRFIDAVVIASFLPVFRV